jgi:hypothetical protein
VRKDGSATGGQETPLRKDAYRIDILETHQRKNGSTFATSETPVRKDDSAIDGPETPVRKDSSAISGSEIPVRKDDSVIEAAEHAFRPTAPRIHPGLCRKPQGIAEAKQSRPLAPREEPGAWPAHSSPNIDSITIGGSHRLILRSKMATLLARPPCNRCNWGRFQTPPGYSSKSGGMEDFTSSSRLRLPCASHQRSM